MTFIIAGYIFDYIKSDCWCDFVTDSDWFLVKFLVGFPIYLLSVLFSLFIGLILSPITSIIYVINNAIEFARKMKYWSCQGNNRYVRNAKRREAMKILNLYDNFPSIPFLH
jgi:hypothetical protein